MHERLWKADIEIISIRLVHKPDNLMCVRMCACVCVHWLCMQSVMVLVNLNILCICCCWQTLIVATAMVASSGRHVCTKHHGQTLLSAQQLLPVVVVDHHPMLSRWWLLWEIKRIMPICTLTMPEAACDYFLGDRASTDGRHVWAVW